MTRIRKLFLLSILVLVAPVALAACGGGGEADIDPEQVLRETFGNDEQVSSGTFDLSLSGGVEGGESPGNGEASLSGSFQGDPEDPASIPQLDLTGSVNFESQGITGGGEGGLTITEDNAYVTFQGATYEVGSELFGAFRDAVEQAAAMSTGGATGAEGTTTTQSFDEQCATLLESVGGNTAACDTIDVFSWFTLTNEGETEVEGAPTIHIHGEVDLAAAIENINAAIAASEIPGATSIPEEATSQVEGAIETLSFDVYSGTEDRLLRGFDINLTIDPSAIPEASAQGITSINAELSFRIGSVNEAQTIEAPADAQPLDDLLGQYGLSTADLETALQGYQTQFGLGGLGSTGLGGDSLGDDFSDDFGVGGAGSGGGSGGGGGGGGGIDDAYTNCILESTSNNPFKECEQFLN